MEQIGEDSSSEFGEKTCYKEKWSQAFSQSVGERKSQSEIIYYVEIQPISEKQQ